MKIGIVAIQGDYEAHARTLERLGVEYTFVRKPEELAGLGGVILPGGESSTHLKIMTEEGLLAALKKFAANGGAFFGTCAGTILLAREVHNPAQGSLALLDISVQRNGYGRQLASDVHSAPTKLRAEPLEMVFIRAPIIESVGKGVEVLAEDAGHPVLVRQGRILASTFHPELTDDTIVHECFLKLARNGSSPMPGPLRILFVCVGNCVRSQMAEALKCSAGTVASRLHQGHKLLAQKLARHLVRSVS